MKNWIFTLIVISFLSACQTTGFGVYHEAKKGETLNEISMLYGVDESLLRAENSLDDDFAVFNEETSVFIPKAEKVLGAGRGAAPEAKEEEKTDSQSKSDETKNGTANGDSTAENQSGKEGITARNDFEKWDNKIESKGEEEKSQETKNGSEVERFVWPAKGKITGYFSAESDNKNDGIEIELKEGEEIRAAESGKILFSAAHNSFGNMVIIQHDERFISVYAYLHTLFAKEGSKVKQNGLIGISGTTEFNKTPLLHFEIREFSKPVNPLKYLPPL